MTILRAGVASVSVLMLTACSVTASRQEMGTVLGGALGGLIASQVADDNEEAWIAFGMLAGGFLGNQLGRYLDERDQQRMAVATQQAAATGVAQTWSNPDNGTAGQARVVSSEVKSQPVSVPVLRERINEVPPLDIMGETYRARGNSNLRGGPGTDYVVVGSLTPGEVVNVVGRVQGQDWFMISQGGVGSGFIYAPLLEAAPGAQPSDLSTQFADEDVYETALADEQLCRTIEQSITLADGSTHSSSMEACQGANGWVAQA